MKRTFFLIIVVSAVLAALNYNFIYDNFRTVTDGRIYRSAQLSEHRLQKIINEKKIKTIINLRGTQGKTSEWYKIESETARKNDVQLYNISFSAFELPRCTSLDSLIDTLINAERPILIHCHGGSHRAGMASALALSIERDPPLSSLKKQFSWRYFVSPLRDSTGSLLFSQYEQWINSTNKKHNRENLLSWIKNEYVDGNGNKEFCIDRVENIIFKRTYSEESRVATIQKTPQTISITGWAFYPRTKTPVDNLYVTIDGQIAEKVKYKYKRPDVAKHFGFYKKNCEGVKLGWLAEFDTSALTAGCHKISLRLVRNESDVRNIPAACNLCFEE